MLWLAKVDAPGVTYSGGCWTAKFCG